MKTIADEWETYKKEVVPPQAGENQVYETRQAFYAGASIVFGTLSQLGKERVPVEVGVSVLTKLMQECTAFAEKTVRGGG